MLLKSLFTILSLASFTDTAQAKSKQPQTIISYNAAGVLPYAIDTKGDTWILVGEEAIKNYKACDFGGSKDHEDGNDPLATAAREGSEELLFIFDEDNATFKKILKYKLSHNFSFNKVHTYNYLSQQLKNTNMNGKYNGYITYLMKVDFNQKLPDLFQKRRNTFLHQLPFCWAEKTKLHWLKLKDAMHAINTGSNKVIDSKGQTVLLFYPFMQSLKNAHDNGSLKSLLK